MTPSSQDELRKKMDKIINKMQMRISSAWEAWDGADVYDQEEMFEKYGDETDAAERTALDEILALIHQHTAEVEAKARIDENRIIWDLPRDKGMIYFEEHIQKRFNKLDAQLADREKKK